SLLWLSRAAGKCPCALDQPPDILALARLAGKIRQRLGQIPPRRRGVSLLEGKASAEIEDARTRAEVAQVAEKAPSFIQIGARRRQIAQPPARASHREGARGCAVEVMLSHEEPIIGFDDPDRARRLVEGIIGLANVVPREPSRPIRLTHLVTNREGFLIQRQRLAWFAHLIVQLTQVQQ